MSHFGLILGALGVIAVSCLWKVLVFLTWRPFLITKRFRKQGVSGPEYRFWSGNLEEIRSLAKAATDIEMDPNSHDILPRVFPEYNKWIPHYGETFLYWFGPQPRLCINDVELVKQVLSNKYGFYVKTRLHSGLMAILGNGLLLIDGEDWVRHRRVVNPAFTKDKLKVMAKKMADCTSSMLDSWQRISAEHNAIEVKRQFLELTADVISYAVFGSSFIEGKEVFLAQQVLQTITLATFLNIDIPAFRYIPTKWNIQKWKLERKMKDTFLKIIQSRLDSKDSGYGNDLLGIMMESAQKHEGMGLNTDEIIDECKSFYFAGHETTSQSITWTMFLLSTNQKWQERLREEVARELGTEIPNADNINKLKLVTMVLYEALRLYSPVLYTMREAAKDMNLGGITVPKGTAITIPFAVIHRRKDLWGEDAHEFNPMRFENGVTNAAKHPNAMLGFSVGPRSCIGQNFAMMEAKIVISMIVQRFSFSLSPDYKHMPADKLTLQPQYGLPIVFKPLAV